MTSDAVATANNTSAAFRHLADSDSHPEHLANPGDVAAAQIRGVDYQA
jgi:hypothetical protein